MARPDEARQALAAAEATGAAPLHVAGDVALAWPPRSASSPLVLARGPELLHEELPDDLARILVASAVSGAAAVTGDSAAARRGRGRRRAHR